MRKKDPVPFSQKIPNADPLALKLLENLLAFDPKDRTTAEEVGRLKLQKKVTILKIARVYRFYNLIIVRFG